MLAKTNRFHGHKSVRVTMAKGRVYRVRTMILRYVQDNNPRSLSRCAVIVSKKTLKSAVKRNRARRRIYNIVRHELKSLSACDIAIIVVSPEVVTMPADQLATELHRLLSPLSRVTSDRT